MANTDTTAGRLHLVETRIADAALRAGRDPAEVKLVVVTKTQSVQLVRDAIDAGARMIGENRIQEALPKMEALRQGGLAGHVGFHLVGHLQTNKARLAVEHFDLIHSVDSLKLAMELNRHAALTGKTCDVLVQVNMSGEESKSGLRPESAGCVLEEILEKCSSLSVLGLMTIGPLAASPEEIRTCFRKMRHLKNEMGERVSGHTRWTGAELSMGMTDDFEIAVEEGATLVRIGSAIFGPRTAHG